jgi:ureidoglycolate lyase
VTTLPLEALTATDFEPYGRVVELPQQEPHATGPGWRWWGEVIDLEGDGRPWSVGYLDLEPTPLAFDWAERHMRSREAIIATSGDVAVYVGPAEAPDHPDQIPPRERFRVFRVPRGSAVVLEPGVWHGAPFALTGPTSALVLLLEGTGRDDVTVVRFEKERVEISLPEE